MSDEDFTDIKDFDDSYEDYDPDSFGLTPIRKTRYSYHAQKRPRLRPKVESEWKDEDICKLINLVEKCRPLWDKENVDYKQPKENFWEKIQESFKGKYSWVECKAKWSNLRVTFKTNVNKELNHKSGQDSQKISWRFFERMRFLTEQSTQSTTASNDPISDLEQTLLSEPEVKNHQKRPRRSRPKVESEWKDEDIWELINLVENRRPLWDKENMDFKHTKENLWKEIQEAFQGKYSSVECKAKWTNLRVTFNTNLNRSGQDYKKVSWRFFKRMSFLTEQSSQSATASNDPLSDTEQTVFSEPEVENHHLLSNEPTTLTQLPETHNKRARPIAATKILSSTPSPDFKTIAAQALVALTKRENKNKYEIFGAYIASELQSLPEYQADYVKRKLNRVFLDLIDESALMPPPP